MASTFYAGIAKASGFHIYLSFQHSSKAWEVGRFTLNVILANDAERPNSSGIADRAKDNSSFAEGPHRIGFIVGSRDKWWHLKDDGTPIGSIAWRPSNYSDFDVVVREAVEDVSRDVVVALGVLNVAARARRP